MKPAITRWKTVPLYSGSWVLAFVAGWVDSLAPVARSTKFWTVFGAWLPNRPMRMSPTDVCRVAIEVAMSVSGTGLLRRRDRTASWARPPAGRTSHPATRVGRTGFDRFRVTGHASRVPRPESIATRRCRPTARETPVARPPKPLRKRTPHVEDRYT